MRAAARLAALFALAAAVAAAPAQSQTLGSVSVGPFKSQKVCSLYADYWGDWLVVECHNNFEALRDRVRSALAESGRLGVTMAPGRYSVTGTVTEVGVQSTSGGGATYAVGGNRAFAGLDVKLVDTRTGRAGLGGNRYPLCRRWLVHQSRRRRGRLLRRTAGHLHLAAA